MWNKDERDGKIDQAKGRAKQAAGDLTGNKDLKAEGRKDEASGKVQEAVGHIRRETGDAIKDIGAAIKK
ncbi:MAG: CsbD family protein [Acidobacteria bacterium]|nr:CsbD family protein [Acidobacteriota bacterium]